MMSAWQVDEMLETESGRLWEQMNAVDPNEERYKDADIYLQNAKDIISKAVDYIIKASECVRGLPMEDKILSIANDVEELGVDAGLIMKEDW